MPVASRPYALVTGASSGIGFELAKCCAKKGFDLLIAADEASVTNAGHQLQAMGVDVDVIQVDLATTDGVASLLARTQNRPVDYLLANAGHGLGKGFIDQDVNAWRHVIETNITGTLLLIQKIARDMRESRRGRILITGSIAGFMPGTYQAVYNGTKAFLDSFSFALRHELKDHGVSVTCLMPGATETEFFERADMMDTKVGQSKKADPADVAKQGFEAMMNGEGEVITGWMNKMRAAMGSVLPADITAAMHKDMAEPRGSTKARAS